MDVCVHACIYVCVCVSVCACVCMHALYVQSTCTAVMAYA